MEQIAEASGISAYELITKLTSPRGDGISGRIKCDAICSDSEKKLQSGVSLVFEHVDAYGGDPILTLVEAFQTGSPKEKVNLSIGLLRRLGGDSRNRTASH